MDNTVGKGKEGKGHEHVGKGKGHGVVMDPGSEYSSGSVPSSENGHIAGLLQVKKSVLKDNVSQCTKATNNVSQLLKDDVSHFSDDGCILPDDSISQCTTNTGVSASARHLQWQRISQKSRQHSLSWLVKCAFCFAAGVGLIVLVSVAPWGSTSNSQPGGQTDITRSLNGQIEQGTGVYTGGKGILVRTPDELDGSDNLVVPATFWVNDIKTPSQLHPSGNPWCPHGKSDGYEDLSSVSRSKCNHPNGPWELATLAAVVGVDGMRKVMKNFDDIQRGDWVWGVFYATHSGSAGSRCHWQGSGWDCPGFWLNKNGTARSDKSKKGAGFYSQGNPTQYLGGGGAGCHWQAGKNAIDQVDANVGKDGLVQDFHCQCNYNFKQDWTAWVQDWIDNNEQKPGFEWRHWLHGNGKAPSWAVNSAICWVNNPRDMIGMQNAIYLARDQWNNRMTPVTDGSDRRYWGWNEVPVTRTLINDPANWDAVMIKLPAQLCGGKQDSLKCLDSRAQEQLEEDMDAMVSQNKLVPGEDHIKTRPGSYMVVVREFEANKGEYQRQFYCEEWESPTGKYRLVFQAEKVGHDSTENANPLDTGVCYLDMGSSTGKGNSTLRLII